VKILVNERPQTALTDRARELAAVAAGHVFLDFDPVLPGWPPEEVPEQTHPTREVDLTPPKGVSVTYPRRRTAFLESRR